MTMHPGEDDVAARSGAPEAPWAELELLRRERAELRALLEVSARDLARAESTLGGLLEAFPVQIVLLDGRGAIVRRNRSWAAEEARLSTELGEGRTYGELAEALFGAPTARKLRAEIDRLMRRDIDTLVHEVESARGARTRWTVIRAARLPCAGEALVAVIHEDATEQRRTDEALRRLPRIEAVSQLAGGIAHNFGDLLTTIQYHATFALDALDEAAPAADEIRQIECASIRASELASRLLAFSRQQSGTYGLLDLNDVILDALPTLRRLGSGLTLDARLDDTVGPVNADHEQIQRVLANLILNARDACPPGGCAIIRTERPQGSDGVCLVVSDDGCGMPEELAARVLEPFVTTKPAGKGAGLGLAVVDAIVQRMGGSIRVLSRPGAGSEIRIELPTAQGELPERPLSRLPLAIAGGEVILLVEDDETLRRAASRALAARRYHVLSEADPVGALKILEDRSIPLALMISDIVMPSMSGNALADRARELRPKLPILLVTGYAPDPSGPSAYPILRKPFNPTQLIQRVRRAIDAAGDRRGAHLPPEAT